MGPATKPPMWAKKATPPPCCAFGTPREATPETSWIRNQKGRNTHAGTRMKRAKKPKKISVWMRARG